MNERIKELAREAGLLAYNPEGPPTKLEKFAELIVRECAAEADKCAAEADKYAERGSWMAGYRIKQHFGVEE